MKFRILKKNFNTITKYLDCMERSKSLKKQKMKRGCGRGNEYGTKWYKTINQKQKKTSGIPRFVYH